MTVPACLASMFFNSLKGLSTSYWWAYTPSASGSGYLNADIYSIDIENSKQYITTTTGFITSLDNSSLIPNNSETLKYTAANITSTVNTFFDSDVASAVTSRYGGIVKNDMTIATFSNFLSPSTIYNKKYSHATYTFVPGGGTLPNAWDSELVSGGGGTFCFKGYTAGGVYKLFFMRLNNDGTINWQKYDNGNTNTNVSYDTVQCVKLTSAGTIFAISDDDSGGGTGTYSRIILYKIDTAGALTWSRTLTDGTNMSSVNVRQMYGNSTYLFINSIFNSGIGSKLLCIKISDGTTVWCKDGLNGPGTGIGAPGSLLGVDETNIYISNNNKIECLSATSGELVWACSFSCTSAFNTELEFTNGVLSGNDLYLTAEGTGISTQGRGYLKYPKAGGSLGTFGNLTISESTTSTLSNSTATPTNAAGSRTLSAITLTVTTNTDTVVASTASALSSYTNLQDISNYAAPYSEYLGSYTSGTLGTTWTATSAALGSSASKLVVVVVGVGANTSATVTIGGSSPTLVALVSSGVNAGGAMYYLRTTSTSGNIVVTTTSTNSTQYAHVFALYNITNDTPQFTATGTTNSAALGWTTSDIGIGLAFQDGSSTGVVSWAGLAEYADMASFNLLRTSVAAKTFLTSGAKTISATSTANIQICSASAFWK